MGGIIERVSGQVFDADEGEGEHKGEGEVGSVERRRSPRAAFSPACHPLLSPSPLIAFPKPRACPRARLCPLVSDPSSLLRTSRVVSPRPFSPRVLLCRMARTLPALPLKPCPPPALHSFCRSSTHPVTLQQVMGRANPRAPPSHSGSPAYPRPASIQRRSIQQHPAASLPACFSLPARYKRPRLQLVAGLRKRAPAHGPLALSSTSYLLSHIPSLPSPLSIPPTGASSLPSPPSPPPTSPSLYPTLSR